ncbi:MAG: OpgC domain-containing protein [Phycisphaerae bacterium]|nr:OpgC domain-containing protein [Tepidisphaeraceae bacterium]
MSAAPASNFRTDPSATADIALPRAFERPSRATSHKKSETSRDYRLDFWRGLCLVDMVLVHLVSEGVKFGGALTAIIGEYARFAAGGFIFLAGLGVSYIFLKKARDPAKRRGTYAALWRRSLYLLFVHYAASLSFVMIYPLRDYGGAYPNFFEFAWRVLTFREGVDLLIFYVIMVALSPFMLEVMRRGYTWLLALASVGLFAWGQWHPDALSSVIPIQKAFMVVLWQMIFVAGMIAGALLPWYDALATRAKGMITAAIWAIIGVVAYLAYTPSGWTWAYEHYLYFAKTPLTTGEAIRYLAVVLAIITTTDLAWRVIADTRVVGFMTRLGRRSLAVYVAHIWVVALMVAVSLRMPWLGNWQALLAIPAVALVYGWTLLLDALSEAPVRRGEEPVIGQAFWRVSGAAVTAVAVLFGIHATLPGGWKAERKNLHLAQVPPPANLVKVVSGDTSDSEYDPDDVLPDLPNEDVTPEDEPAGVDDVAPVTGSPVSADWVPSAHD